MHPQNDDDPAPPAAAVATLVGCVVVGVGWLLSAAAASWRDDNLFSDALMPWYYANPWGAAVAVGINLAVLARLWMFLLRIEAAAANARRVEERVARIEAVVAQPAARRAG